ncbi:MAG: DUF6382 domain-containing protein, partial [Lachnospiraceae bacterium]|nr:DUF6382 domain-containing protein [Lachnospiraceae bacterium]
MIIIQEMGRSYLCTDIMEDGECSYMERMLTDNVISGQPVCRRGIFQNRDVLKYDITNMKNICREYESKTMSFAELSGLLQGIAEQLCNGAAYLLDEEYYVFDPEYIYIDMETGRLNLICVPYKCRENDIEERFHKLADFILEKIEHKEEHAASIAYQFYRMSKERLFSIAGFCSIIEKENDLANREDGRIRRGTVTSGRIPDEGYEPGKEKDLDQYEGSWDEEERSADQNRNPRLLPILAGITGVLGISALGLYLTVGKRSPYNIQILCAAVILPGTALLIGIKLLIGFVTSKKEKELEDEMTGRTVWPERVNGHIGTETRPKLLREAAVGNIAQWGKPTLLALEVVHELDQFLIFECRIRNVRSLDHIVVLQAL